MHTQPCSGNYEGKPCQRSVPLELWEAGQRLCLGCQARMARLRLAISLYCEIQRGVDMTKKSGFLVIKQDYVEDIERLKILVQEKAHGKNKDIVYESQITQAGIHPYLVATLMKLQGFATQASTTEFSTEWQITIPDEIVVKSDGEVDTLVENLQKEARPKTITPELTVVATHTKNDPNDEILFTTDQLAETYNMVRADASWSSEYNAKVIWDPKLRLKNKLETTEDNATRRIDALMKVTHRMLPVLRLAPGKDKLYIIQEGTAVVRDPPPAAPLKSKPILTPQRSVAMSKNKLSNRQQQALVALQKHCASTQDNNINKPVPIIMQALGIETANASQLLNGLIDAKHVERIDRLTVQLVTTTIETTVSTINAVVALVPKKTARQFAKKPVKKPARRQAARPDDGSEISDEERELFNKSFMHNGSPKSREEIEQAIENLQEQITLREKLVAVGQTIAEHAAVFDKLKPYMG